MLTEKHRPQHIEQVRGQNLTELVNWAKTWKFRQSYQSAFLYGPPGTGKTSTALALANDMEWEYLEINASDVRTSKAIKEDIGHAIYNTPFSSRVLILIDEVDGILQSKGEKKHSISTLEELIDQSRNPIILTCNDEYAIKKVSKYFRDSSLMVKFSPIRDSILEVIVERIAGEENIQISNLPNLVKASHGDLRFALNNIQTEPEPRHEDKDIFKILHDIFAGYWDGDLSNEDIEFVWFAVKGNIYNFYNDVNGQTVPEFIQDVDRIFEHLYHDLPIQTKRAYRYWPYIIQILKLMPRHQKTAMIKIYPTKIPDIRKEYYKKKDPEIQRFANHLHISYAKANTSEMKQMLPYFRVNQYVDEDRVVYKSPSLSIPLEEPTPIPILIPKRLRQSLLL